MKINSAAEPRPGAERANRIGKMPVLMLVMAATVLLIGLCVALALHDWSDFTPVDGKGGSRRSATLAASLRPPAVDPVSDPAALRDISREDAVKLNADMPFSTEPNPAARGLAVPIGDGISYLRALDCMTAAVHYEAASEAEDGLRAVAQVVLNRVRHPAFPHSVCAVVFQGAERQTGCQFSFTCDGSLTRIPTAAAWTRARRIASEALAGRVYAPVGWSTHYHTDWVAPYWAPTLVKTAVVGAHIFYRWPEGWGKPRAFSQAYSGEEVLPDVLGGTGILVAGSETAPPGAAVSIASRPVLSITGQAPEGVGAVAGRRLLLDRVTTPGDAGKDAPPVRRVIATQALTMSGTKQEPSAGE